MKNPALVTSTLANGNTVCFPREKSVCEGQWRDPVSISYS